MEQEEELGPFYTIQEAAKVLRVSEGTVWRWVRDRKLPAYKVGDRAIRIKKEDLPKVLKRTDMEAKMVERTATSDKEQQLLALKQAGALRAKIERRVGKPLPSSAEEIRALREERARRVF
jgi:excisionase family DNA binding protein